MRLLLMTLLLLTLLLNLAVAQDETDTEYIWSDAAVEVEVVAQPDKDVVVVRTEPAPAPGSIREEYYQWNRAPRREVRAQTAPASSWTEPAHSPVRVTAAAREQRMTDARIYDDYDRAAVAVHDDPYWSRTRGDVRLGVGCGCVKSKCGARCEVRSKCGSRCGDRCGKCAPVRAVAAPVAKCGCPKDKCGCKKSKCGTSRCAPKAKAPKRKCC